MTRRWHRPSWFALLLFAAGLALFLALARWQWARAEEKEVLLAAYAASATAPTQSLSPSTDALPAEVLPRVRVNGRYRTDRGYWLVDQVRDGRNGRYAIGVFTPNGEAADLLVNLGWVASPAGVTLPAFPSLPADDRILEGIYAPPPGGGLRMGGDALPRQKSWPKETIFLDQAAIAADLGSALRPRLLLLDAESGSPLRREWTPAIIPPSRHRGYAFQWLSFAVAAVVIFVVLHWRKDQKGHRT
ncbi:SURF1 family protein [Tahibacter amnicola]|uniref:SURF1-like protein n=1 Tax=Tahibacter amnicola TaxID=2976241 RepID=A0ABY6BLG3_9GAMM|nr:SURF1 family protein [Tahibacter amnicola]UXI68652.1 SURF1 family protein [Tahibacter amnicola]